MRRLLLLLIGLLGMAAVGHAQTDAFNGVCVQGGVTANVSGLASSNRLMGIIPSCTITVYQTGTTTKATIYSNSISTPLANPFTAAALGSTAPGQWLFYAATGVGYDVVMSGGIAPLVYATPVTLTDLKVGGGGGSGPVVEVNGTPISPASPANFVDTSSVTWAFVSGAIKATAAGGGGSCGPVEGDATSTDCGNGNLTDSSGADRSAYGELNITTTAGDDVVGVGDGNLVNGTGHDQVAVGDFNLINVNGHDNVAVGDQNMENNGSKNATNFVALGNGNAIRGGGSDVLLAGDSNYIDSDGNTNVVALGNTNAGTLTNSNNITAIGNNNANLLTDGSSDLVALGDGAGSDVQGVITNVVDIGDGAGANSLGAQSDVINIGQAGGGQTSGSVHSAISLGVGSGSANNGSNIFFAGDSAGVCNNGDQNNAIGNFAMGGLRDSIVRPNCTSAQVTGTENIAWGDHALTAVQGGSENIAIGKYSGSNGYVDPLTVGNSNVTGSNNTWVGAESGPNTTTQLSNTIALGWQAVNTASNQTVIGNNSITTVTIFGVGTGCLSATAGVITGSGSACGSGGGGGSNVTVNGGGTLSTANLGSTPAAGTNGLNVTWQNSGSGVSAEIVGDGNSAHFLNGIGTYTTPGGGGGGFPITIGSTSIAASSTTTTIAGLTLTAPTMTAPVLGTIASGNGGNLTSLNATNVSSGNLANARLASQTANTVLGALTATTPSGLAMPSCSGGTNALIWTTGTGFGCNTISGGGATAWSAITNPTGNLALTMAANTSTFTYNATTGSSDLFKLTDTASNTGTGILLHATAAASSTEIPFQADANGVGWEVDVNGKLVGVGSSASHSAFFPTGTLDTPAASNAGLSSDSSGNLESSDNGGAFARVCNATNDQCFLLGATGTITGTALTATCDSGTATVTGAVVGKPVMVSSTTGADIGGAFNIRGSVTSSNTVTVYVCGTGTPSSLAYNVAVVP